MNDYLLGLATIPTLAVIAFAVAVAGHWTLYAVRRWWLSPVEFSAKDWERRIKHASCVLAARRVRAIKLPGSRLLVFRSTVGGSDYRYGVYYGDTDDLQRRASNALLDEFDPWDGES